MKSSQTLTNIGANENDLYKLYKLFRNRCKIDNVKTFKIYIYTKKRYPLGIKYNTACTETRTTYCGVNAIAS